MNEESLFAAALEKESPAERQAFLDEACAGDAALRQRVEQLLLSDAKARGILEAGPGVGMNPLGPSSLLAADSLFGGRFKLRQKLGEGGMGEVWVADQIEPVQRRVALKVVRPGLDSARMLARFEQERQALALMDHPNIAKVLDAGVADGRPYFVMELIKGVPITKYCDDAKLSPRERLELFIPVCQAVQHAHQKGIIHRDLKPTNIIVGLYDGKPIPKVIDFGVAKATGPRLTENSVYTEIGTLIGTLEYMSPEQAELNNLDVDTRSDIYTLGAILYELLTGSVPFSRQELQSAAFNEMLRMIKEVDPPRPSTRLSGSGTLPSVAAVRQTEPKKLIAMIRGELDWIVIKCLEKDRSRRYETANALALDLRQFLADETVTASPPSPAYRCRKFVRRNRGPVLAATLVVLALVGGVLGTTIGLVRAENRAAGERRAKDTAEKRLAQLEKGIDILASLFADLDPMAEEKEGRPLRAILGDRLDKAAAELEGESVGDPLVVARLQDRLGRTYLGLGLGAPAEALLTKAAATRQDMVGPNDPLTLETRHNLAMAQMATGRLTDAIGLFEEVRDARTRVLGPDHLDTLSTLNELAAAYARAANPNAALPILERVRDGRVNQLGETHDLTLNTMSRLADVYIMVHRRGDAVALAEKVWQARVKIHGDEHPKAVAAMNLLAYVYQAAYRMKEALALYQHARDNIVPKLGDYHPLTLVILRNLGHMLRVYRRNTEAIPLLEQVRERELMVLGGHNPNALPAVYELAMAYQAAGHMDKALPMYQLAIAVLEKLDFKHSFASHILSAASHFYEELKQFEQAQRCRRMNLEVVKRMHGDDSADYAEELIRVGSLLLQQKKPAAAEPPLRQALTILEMHPNAGEKFYAQSLLGMVLADQERYGEAEPLLMQAYRGMKNFAVEHKRAGLLPIGREIDALDRLVKLYDDWNKPGEAEKWRAERESRKKEFDEFNKLKRK